MDGLTPLGSAFFCRKRLRADSQTRGTFLERASTRAALIGFEQLLQRGAFALGVDLLSRFQSHAEQIAAEDRLENVFQTAHHGNRIQVVEETEMRDAEQLALHFSLPVGDD